MRVLYGVWWCVCVCTNSQTLCKTPTRKINIDSSFIAIIKSFFHSNWKILILWKIILQWIFLKSKLWYLEILQWVLHLLIKTDVDAPALHVCWAIRIRLQELTNYFAYLELRDRAKYWAEKNKTVFCKLTLSVT